MGWSSAVSSGIHIKVDRTGTDGISRLLSDLSSKMQDLTPAMRDIGEIIVDHIKGNFRDSIAPDGTPWKPSRRVIREGGKTLIDTGVLRNSFHARAGRRSVLVGTPDERASTHQFGRGNIPARPFMPDPERFPRCLAEDIQESILDFLRIR